MFSILKAFIPVIVLGVTLMLTIECNAYDQIDDNCICFSPAILKQNHLAIVTVCKLQHFH